jgi:two-component system phosphate regulon sensor histidine kinase PhoR
VSVTVSANRAGDPSASEPDGIGGDGLASAPSGTEQGPASIGAPPPSRWRIPHRIAAKVALVATALIGVPLVALSWATGGPDPARLVAIPVVFAGAYLASGFVLGRRITLARTVLREIRRSRFENLEAARLPRGDELNDLVWQVYRTGQVLEREMQDLRKTEVYRKEFLGNVSHELKTPIFAIRGFTETLLGGAVDDGRVNRSFLDKILRNSDRLGNLVRDLGEISRIESGELTMVMAPFDLRATVCEVVESLEPIARDRSVTLRTAVPAGLPRAVGDADRLRQVLVNLVDNAIKYNKPDGQVEVVARHVAGGRIKLSIVDDGIGIDPDHIPRLTERFYRVDRSRSRSQGGTGLGLAIVKHILAAHDAHLVVESRPGRGSTFGFSLRAAE